MSEQKPSVGRIVHYVSHGTPGGEYTSQCRAAVITALAPDDHQDERHDCVSLCVLNPTGQFFNIHTCHDEDGKRGGTWHWAERV